jgi:hypothetical protein
VKQQLKQPVICFNDEEKLGEEVILKSKMAMWSDKKSGLIFLSDHLRKKTNIELVVLRFL